MCVVAFAVAFAAALAVALALAWLATLDGSDAHSSQNHVWASERNDEQDQRFSTVAATLTTAPILEDPEEMRDWLLEHIAPPRGRRLIVEILPCTMDFKSWQAPLDIQMAGITSTHWQPHANHVWRFVKRSDMCGYNGSDKWNIQWGCEEWKDLEAHPNDVIALYKESMHSTSLQQMPMVVMPYQVACGKLKKEDLKPAPRKILSPTEMKEYAKTANKIEKEPWNLQRGAAYLRSLIAKQEDEVLSNQLLDFKFIHEHMTMTTTERAPDVIGLHYAPDAVRAVSVLPPGSARGAKRKAKAKPAHVPAPKKRLKRPAAAAEDHAEAEAEEIISELDLPEAEDDADAEEDLLAGQDEAAPARAPAAPPSAPAPGPMSFGCSKCRWGAGGCAQCRRWATCDLPGRGCGGRRGRGGRRGA